MEAESSQPPCSFLCHLFSIWFLCHQCCFCGICFGSVIQQSYIPVVDFDFLYCVSGVLLGAFSDSNLLDEGSQDLRGQFIDLAVFLCVFNEPGNIASPLAIRTQRSNTSQDLPIFGAPPRMLSPWGRKVWTQNLGALRSMSRSVSPSMTDSLLISSVTFPPFSLGCESILELF